MNKEDINKFNELSRKLCDELKPKNCMDCPFCQWDGYFNCFDKDGFKYPINEGDELYKEIIQDE